MGRRKQCFYMLIGLLSNIIYSQFYSAIPKKHVDDFGIYIYDVSNKEDIFTLNINKDFIPASNMKILLAGALLSNIDINSRLCNRFYVSEVDNNIELNIIGGGAFNFDQRRPFEEFEQFYEHYKDSLVSRSIKTINLDDSIFDKITTNKFWDTYSKLEWWIPAVSPFVFNSNLLNIVITHRRNSFTIRQTPFQFLENIDSGNLHCLKKCNLNLLKVEYKTSTSIRVEGSSCCNKVIIKQIPVENPVIYYGKALIHFFKQKNINLTGELTFKEYKPATNAKFFEYCTPLKRLLQHFIKSSDNLVAEVLLKYLGYKLYNEGSFEKGALAVYNFLKSIVKDNNYEMAIYDGSGISRLNKVSPYIIIKTLNYLYEKLGDDIYQIFPKGGEKRTTLRGRFKNFPLQIWAKTGFLNNVYALSGIAKNSRNTFLFSILYNGSLGKWKVYSIQEKILKILSHKNIKKPLR